MIHFAHLLPCPHQLPEGETKEGSFLSSNPIKFSSLVLKYLVSIQFPTLHLQNRTRKTYVAPTHTPDEYLPIYIHTYMLAKDTCIDDMNGCAIEVASIDSGRGQVIRNRRGFVKLSSESSVIPCYSPLHTLGRYPYGDITHVQPCTES